MIAGVGGQGVNTLAKVLANTLHQSNIHCQFTVHKGGAQSLGSVYAEFRINNQKLSNVGQGIPKGQLDILVSLEPWEALRHVALAHSKTQLWVETQVMPFFTDRTVSEDKNNADSPQAQLDALPDISIHWKSYREVAQHKMKTIKMANYFAGLDCITALNSFSQSINKSQYNHIETTLFDTLFFKCIDKKKQARIL